MGEWRETVEHALGAQCHSLVGDRRARTHMLMERICDGGRRAELCIGKGDLGKY